MLLDSAEEVLAIEPDWSAAAGMDIGVVGPYPEGSECAVEIRAFCPEMGIAEDPVTGSLNAGVAQWLAGDRLPDVVRRLPGHRSRPARAGVHRARGRHRLGGW